MGLEGSVFSWRFGAPRHVSVFLRVSCRLVFSLLPILSSFVFFFSPSPPSFYPSASSLDLFVSSLARSISGARGLFVFARESFRRLVGRFADACVAAAGRLANNARRDPPGLRAEGPSSLAQSLLCAQEARRGSSGREGKCSAARSADAGL